MKKNLINQLNNISGRFNTNFLVNLAGHKLLLPAYHAIANNKPPHLKHLYAIRSEKQFIIDLDFFLKHWKPIDLETLVRLSKQDTVFKNKMFHLSFDDGLKEVYEIVYPILKAKGVPATFFLNTDFIDNKNYLFRFVTSLIASELEKIKEEKCLIDGKTYSKAKLSDLVWKLGINEKDKLSNIAAQLNIDLENYFEATKPYLSTQQVREMMSHGFTFGAHSTNHPDYRQLSFEQQLTNTRKSIEAVKEKFGVKINSFAFPFTDDEISIKFFKESEEYIDLSFGGAGLKKDSIKSNLQRIPMDRTNHSAKTIINTEYLYYIIKAPLLKNKIKRS